MSNSPVRVIGITNRSVSGLVPGIGRFESSLERDMMERLRFDPLIDFVRPQPIEIEYLRADGKSAKYTPDGLISFKASLAKPIVLYEVKYREDFRKDRALLIPKFRAAQEVCSRNGWRFEVFTEHQIRTTYLKNIRFLWPYKQRTFSVETMRWIYEVLLDLDEADPDFLMHALCRDKKNRAELIPVLWHMIAIGYIDCDLDLALTMHSKIWPSGAEL